MNKQWINPNLKQTLKQTAMIFKYFLLSAPSTDVHTGDLPVSFLPSSHKNCPGGLCNSALRLQRSFDLPSPYLSVNTETWQSSSSSCSPLQGFPPFIGDGLLHSRVLLLLKEVSHGLHSDQQLQRPSTASARNKRKYRLLINLCHTFINPVVW